MKYSKFLSVLFLLASFASFGHSIVGKPRQQRLFIEGNSLMNWSVNHGVINGRYVSQGIYNSVRVGRTLTVSDYATSSQNQTQINAAVGTRVTPYIIKGDIILLWEGTNDLYTNGLTAQAAYDNLVSYSNTVRAAGAKLVVATIAARDYSSDPGDLMTRIAAYNTLVRDDPSVYDALVDLAADTHFDERADASNATYYNADKLHLATAGQDLVITLLSAGITSVLN